MILRTLLISLFIVHAVFAAPENPDGSGSGDNVPTPSSSSCVAQGNGVITLTVLFKSFPLGDFDATKAAGLSQILAGLALASPACVQILETGIDKNFEGFAHVVIAGLNQQSVDQVISITGQIPAIVTLFSAPVEVVNTQGTPDTSAKEDAIKNGPAILPCAQTGFGTVVVSLSIPNFNVYDWPVIDQMKLLAFFGNALNIEGGCVQIVSMGVDSATAPFVDVFISNLVDPDTIQGLIVATDLTNLATLSFGGLPVLLLKANADKGKDPSATVSAPTTTFDYFSLLPMAIDNIDPVTGLFNPTFHQRVIDGCTVDRNFCISIMNFLTSYIHFLSLPKEEPVDKTDSMYSTKSSSGSSLSLASVLAISGSALAFVVIAAMVVAKVKTGRFIPFRPSSRVSFSNSDLRTLSASPSRISVRAWPNAMEV